MNKPNTGEILSVIEMRLFLGSFLCQILCNTIREASEGANQTFNPLAFPYLLSFSPLALRRFFLGRFFASSIFESHKRVNEKKTFYAQVKVCLAGIFQTTLKKVNKFLCLKRIFLLFFIKKFQAKADDPSPLLSYLQLMLDRVSPIPCTIAQFTDSAAALAQQREQQRKLKEIALLCIGSILQKEDLSNFGMQIFQNKQVLPITLPG